MEDPKKHQRLMELIGLLRDAGPSGGLDEAQAAELESIIQEDPKALAYYVESMDVIAMLHRQRGLVAQNPNDGKCSNETASVVAPPKHRRSWYATGLCVAVCASLLIGVLAGRMLMPAGDQIAMVDHEPEIATLNSAAGCRWEPNSDSPYEGQRLSPGNLRLAEGVAVVHFDSDVSLVLEGPAHLELADVDRAMLHRGKAVFSGADDLDQFTLETPFSKIQDEGTEYAVSVDPQNELQEIHVFDGRVICDQVDPKATALSSKTIQLDAGEARRFDGSRSIETIAVDSARFARKPVVRADSIESTMAVESFSYSDESLAGQKGGTGWRVNWTQPERYESNQGATVQTGKSLLWPGRDADDDKGSLLIAGDAGLHRVLQEPIRMDRDAAYYISFLVRKNPTQNPSKKDGWFYVTLRSAVDKEGSIAISPFGLRGKPRVTYDGRSGNYTSQLREDATYLFVCKIMARKSKDDQVTLRIYADRETVDSVEPSAWSVTTRPVRVSSVLSDLRLYAKNSAPIQLDEIRVGKTWSSVTSPFVK